ncbi:MAG: hypothetical protein K2P90_01080 [Holosporales bacterium]|nr:hypothetical protein [Holosporales bacterium]
MNQKERGREKMTKKQKTNMGIGFFLTFGTFMSQQVFADAQQTATDVAQKGFDAGMIGYDVSGALEGNPSATIDLDKRLDKYTGINQKAVDAAKTVQNQVQNVETQVAQGAKDFGNQVSSAFKHWHW